LKGQRIWQTPLGGKMDALRLFAKMGFRIV
jgi:hypothetical protein